MSTTSYHLRTLRTLDKMAHAAGFGFKDSSRSDWSDSSGFSLLPANDKLPVYAKDAVIATGTAEELIAFLQGWNKMKEYLTVLRAVDDKKIERKEQDYKNVQLAKILKGEKTNVTDK